jgi:hypothetical protein
MITIQSVYSFRISDLDANIAICQNVCWKLIEGFAFAELSHSIGNLLDQRYRQHLNSRWNLCIAGMPNTRRIESSGPWNRTLGEPISQKLVWDRKGLRRRQWSICSSCFMRYSIPNCACFLWYWYPTRRYLQTEFLLHREDQISDI